MAKDFAPRFDDLQRDIDRYADRHCEKGEIGGTPAVFGYDEAVDAVFDHYVEAEAYDALIDFLLNHRTHYWGLNDKFLKVSDILHGKRHTARLFRMWRPAIATQKQFFWEHRAHRDTLDIDDTIAKTKAGALDTMERFAAILADLGEDAAVYRLRGEIADLQADRRPKPPGKPDPRAMTEDLFWEIIDGAAGDSSGEEVAAITEQLARFKATQIKAFDTLLRQAMDAAYHYDLWALAFLAQDGCSDDAFEGFRAWLILQGRAAFDTALSDPVAFLRSAPVGIECAAEALLQTPAIAYEWRTSKALKPAKRKPGEIQGEPWDDENLPTRYPDLVRQINAMRAE